MAAADARATDAPAAYVMSLMPPTIINDLDLARHGYQTDAMITGMPVPAPDTLIPYARARELEGAVWSLGMAHQYPSRYRAVVQELLAAILNAPPPTV
jgi:hypothetical protein